MNKSPSAANNTGGFEKQSYPKIAKLKQEAQNESNRYCEKNRRFRAGGDSEGNSQDHATAGRRPLTDNIDTGFGVLYECGIRYREIHRELNTYKELPTAGGCSMIGKK